MDEKVNTTKQDLTHLVWSRYRHSSGTAGSFLKSYEEHDGKRVYYKLSAFDTVNGIWGHECVNEIIADRLLTLFEIEHVPYRLLYADVLIDDIVYETHLCVSDDFKRPGEKKVAFDIYYEQEKRKSESPIKFCKRMGWTDQVDAMLLLDYLILNRDRHGANIEVLKDPRNKTVRIAPLYDHGLSLLFSCNNKKDVDSFDVMEDKRIQCFVGGSSAFENLSLICKPPINRELKPDNKDYIFYGLSGIIPEYLIEKIWIMILSRWTRYSELYLKGQ